MVLVAMGNFITEAGLPPIFGMPKEVVVPKAVPSSVGAPAPSAYVRAVPTVALKIATVEIPLAEGLSVSFRGDQKGRDHCCTNETAFCDHGGF